MKKFWTKSIQIEAIQWTGGNTEEVINLEPADFVHKPKTPHWRSKEKFSVRTRSGIAEIKLNDWVIKEPGDGGDGYYPCSNRVFHAKYEACPE